MPLDFRRFNGPEDSISYKRYAKDYIKPYDELFSKLLDKNGLRKGGRALDEARTLCMFFARVDMVSQSKGSSYIELKKTKVVCSVFDPREIPHQNEFSELGKIFCEVKFAPFSCPRKRRPHAPDAEEKALSEALRQALEPSVCRHLFPNYQIDVFVYILEHDGSCLAAAVNAAGLALANAAVPMYDVITACSVALIKNQVFVDPTEEEEYLALMNSENGENHGVITLSTLSKLKVVSDINLTGSIDQDLIVNILDILEKECEKLVVNVRKVLVQDVVKAIDEKLKLDKDAKEREEMLNKKMEEWKLLLNGG